jgi:hypothetical protein
MASRARVAEAGWQMLDGRGRTVKGKESRGRRDKMDRGEFSSTYSVWLCVSMRWTAEPPSLAQKSDSRVPLPHPCSPQAHDGIIEV